MGTSSLSPFQVLQIQQVAEDNKQNPTAVWAALASMGDQYAQAALQGLTNPASTYGQVISNSTWVSGVTGDTVQAMANAARQRCRCTPLQIAPVCGAFSGPVRCAA